MHSYSLLLLVLSFSSVKQTISKGQLKADAFPEFLNAQSGQFSLGKPLRLDDPSRYSIRQMWGQGGIPVISIDYHFQQKTMLFKRNDQTKELAWGFVDSFNPFKILSLAITSDLPDALKVLADAVPFEISFGLDNVLEKLNVVDWSKELLKQFYKKCSFTRWHVPKKTETTRETEYLRLMMKNQPKQISNDMIDYFLFNFSQDSQDILFYYKNILDGFWSKTINQVFINQTGNQFVDFINLEKSDGNVTSFHLRDSKFTSDELIAFHRRLKVYTDTITAAIEEYRTNSPETAMLVHDLDVMSSVYMEQIAPLVESKLFPVFSILLRQINLYDATGDAGKFIRNLLAKNQEILNEHHKTPNQKLLGTIYTGYIQDSMNRYIPQKKKFPELIAVVTKLLKRLLSMLRKDLRKMPSLDFDNAWKFVESQVRKFVRHQMLISPMEYMIDIRIKGVLFNVEPYFTQSDLMRLGFVESQKVLAETLMYFVGLLGGKSLSETTSQVTLLFKLKKRTRASSSKFLI